jgi:integrase
MAKQQNAQRSADRMTRSAELADGLPAAFNATAFDPADPALAEVLSPHSGVVLRTDALPPPMQREIGWWLARCQTGGERIAHSGEWNSWVRTALDVIGRTPSISSFADLGLAEWMTAWARVFHATRGHLAAPGTRARAESAVREMLALLAVHYSDAAWWAHDLWSLRLDPRIPHREHEPRGQSSVRWDDIEPKWLRDGFKYYLHLQLESGQLTWSTVAAQHVFTARIAAFFTSRGIDHPALVDDPGRQLRALALDFRSFLGGWRGNPTGRGQRAGGDLNALSIARSQQVLAAFYRTMSDYRAEAAAALGDERWLALSDSHARLYHAEELTRGRVIHQADERNYIGDADLARMLEYVELLGLPREQSTTVTRSDGSRVELAGFGRPALMRAWLIQALTGRRAAEVLGMDFDPLSEIPGVDADAVSDGGMVARLRYQQTKIDGAPASILVGADVTAIVGEQQDWVRERWNLGPTGSIRYLFPRLAGNRRGERAWETSHYDGQLRRFSEALDLRDANGAPLRYSRSHRLRHTKATTLLNAGAPIHVVQRYLGHRSPEMVMRYAATLASTAEREFLAFVKIGRDGRQVEMDRRDMLDLLQLDRRTDRILPNGYCLLPPSRSCEKGNACHGCDHFATDRSHLAEIRRQLAETEQLIERRQAQHTDRYGEPMSESNVWLEQRRSEVRSMRAEIAALQAQPEGEARAVRGAGVTGRPGYQPGPVPVTITRGRPT